MFARRSPSHEHYVSRGWSSIEQEFESEAMRHLDDLHRAAVRMIGGAPDAQDLVQEVFLQAWRSFDRYERGTNCRAWLLAILFNKVQHYRRKKYTRKVVTLDDDDRMLDDLASPPVVATEITDAEILDALARLPETYRDVVILADVQELTYRETAQILEVPIGTVMSRLSRGRRMLRAMLADCARDFGISATQDPEPTS